MKLKNVQLSQLWIDLEIESKEVDPHTTSLPKNEALPHVLPKNEYH